MTRQRLGAILILLGFFSTSAQAEKVIVVAGGGTGGDGGAATEAKLDKPFGVAFDRAGNMYIAEMTGNRIRKVDAKGVITTIAGTSTPKGKPTNPATLGDGGPALKADIDGVHTLAVAPSGDIYLADTWNTRVRKIDAKTGTMTTLAGTGKKAISGDGGPGEKADIDGAANLVLDPKGEKCYITGFSKVVRVVDLKTGVISTVEGIVGGRSCVVDSKGNLYVTTGGFLSVLEPGAKKARLLEEKTGAAKLAASPKTLAVDADDNIYIADELNHLIRKYVVKESKLLTIAGTGKPGSAGVGGPPQMVELKNPHGVHVHADGSVYICDTNNNRVLKIVP